MTRFLPLDLRCPTCQAHPGTRCHWNRPDGTPVFREPHAARVTVARDAGNPRSRARRRWPPSSV